MRVIERHNPWARRDGTDTRWSLLASALFVFLFSGVAWWLIYRLAFWLLSP